VARHVMIRNADGSESVIRESELPAEKNLHDVLTQHPQLLPADDLELGATVVVGRESGLESGYADLVLVDGSGQLCLVEVKKEGNPDTRRVIAQLLDYAAALWQVSVEDFERGVLQPYLHTLGVSDELPDLASYVREHAPNSSDSPEGTDGPPVDDDFVNRLGQTLTSGQFRLVVAAPSIPKGVEKVIEYLNAQGHLIYGLEISFFSGQTECFVPRLVIKPRVSEIRKGAAKATPIAEEDFLQALPERVREAVRQFLHRSGAVGGRLIWNSYGPGVWSSRSPERLVAFLEKGRTGVVVKPPKEYPSEPFTTAHEAIEEMGVGSTSSDDWQHSIKYELATDEQIARYFKIALQLLEQLAPRVSFEVLGAPILSNFTRNDHNIWAKAVPSLDGLRGRWLRGTLSAQPGSQVPVKLEPLAAGAPGWRPRFDAASVENDVWPAGKLQGEYQLVVEEAGDP
jgi:hypothetical protein